VDWDTGDLAIYEIATGKKRRLTNDGSWDEPYEFAEFSRWSPGGKQIVYDWYNKDNFIELRIVGLDDSKPRILYCNEEVDWARTYDWSPDGKQILASFSRKDGPEQIVLVSVSNGSVRVLKTLDRWPGNMCFSPDGRYIVYDFPQKEDSSDRDISVMSVDGNREIPLVKHPAHDFVHGWAPDGKHILFVSDRTGSPDMWVVTVSDGNPQGVPELVKPGKGPFPPVGLGFTKDGSFYYGYRPNKTNVYIAEIDPMTGRIISHPREAINRFVESNGTPDYSPDGKYLAYVSRRPPMPTRYTTNPIGNVLCVRSLETGEEREFRPEINKFGWPRWSPDGRSVLVVDWDANNLMGYYRIDTQTGNVTPVLPRTRHRNLFGRHEWSRDGKSIFYGRRDRKENISQVILRDLKSGTEKVLYRSNDEYNISLSPDGQWLALIFSSKEKPRLIVMPAAGGEPRELCRLEKGDGFTFGHNCEITWTDDGKYILYTVRNYKSDDQKRELYRIPAEGGEPQKLGLKMSQFVNLCIHPDGRHIAFSSREKSFSEVWVMENFLSTMPFVKPEPRPTVRKIGGDWGTFASLSPDSRYLCDVDWDTENLAVIELTTSKVHHLTRKNPDDACYPLDSAISPDSRQVAYLWWDPNTKASSLHIVGIDGSGDRLLCKGKYAIPKAWSADAKKILAIVSENDVQQIVWISASDGSMQQIASFSAEGLGYPGKFDISPDERFIAYDRPQAENTSQRDIFIFDLIENREFYGIHHPSDDKLLGWTPDGGYILFTSYRTGIWDAWLQKLVDGKPQGYPKLVKQGIGEVRPIGFTPQGSYYYAYEQELQDVFTARLDLETGAVLSEPMPVRQTGATSRHDWSPDGLYLAYCERRTDKSQVIYIRTLATGKERILADNVPRIRWLRWALNGQSILIDSAKREDSKGVIYKIDVQTGELTALVRSETEVLIRPEMSPDGKTLFFDRIDPRSRTSRLMARDLESGLEKELFRAEPPARISGSALSPDGQQFVLSIMPSRAGPEGPVLKTLSTAGGEPRELIQFKISEKLRAVGVTWMPDSQNILFWKWHQHFEDLELYRISAEGGEPRKLWLRKTLSLMRVHPDGQHVAFYDRSTTRGIWVMENFLPEVIPSARPASATTLRMVTDQLKRGYASVSADGKYMTELDLETYDLVVREIATGKKQQLTSGKGYALDSLISPDDKKVAYFWDGPIGAATGLYIIGIDGTGRRLLRQNEYLVPRDWSADGKQILGILFGEDQNKMVWVSTTDGTMNEIKPIGKADPYKVDISPDERFIAYDHPQAEGTSKRDIFVFDIEQNRETCLVEHSANDRLLGWIPNGKSIFFVSDRVGTLDGWLLNVVDGEAKGIPRLVQASIGDVTPIGFTQSGDYYFGRYQARPANYTARLNLDTGEVLAEPSIMQYEVHQPRLSPDGRYLAYCSRTEENSQIIHIQDMETGRERVLDPSLPRFDWLCWRPDSQSLLATSFKETPHLYTIDAQTGQRHVLLRSETGEICAAEISPDGKSLFYLQAPGGKSLIGKLLVKNLQTDREREILSFKLNYGLPWWTLSPDGANLAIGLHEREGDVLKKISTETGQTKDLFRSQPNGRIETIAWMPDGNNILFWLGPDIRFGINEETGLWRISTEGGQAKNLWTPAFWTPQTGAMSYLCIHPDGQRIAFGASELIGQIWVMENFLPTALASAEK
jgi:Tol biopolymer transport system component